MGSKQNRRKLIETAIDALVAQRKEIDDRIKSLTGSYEGEWVIRHHVLKQRTWVGGTGYPVGYCRYLGCRNPGTRHYQRGFLFNVPRYESNGDEVKVFKSARDAMFVAECEAGADRKYETQDYYVIEVVDRLDGEVYGAVETPWRSSSV